MSDQEGVIDCHMPIDSSDLQDPDEDNMETSDELSGEVDLLFFVWWNILTTLSLCR